MTTSTAPLPTSTRSTLEQRLLTASLLVAPVTYLAADTTFAARGWEDATGGVLQVLASIAYGFVFLRVAGWLAPTARLRAAIVVVGLIGMAGAVAYGFDTIHMSLGDTQLVDQPGAANLIKPLGLFFPLAFALVGAALVRLGARWQGGLVVFAALAWPVGHIGNIAPVGVAVNVLLVLGLGTLLWQPPTSERG
jgi:hypothetical protein